MNLKLTLILLFGVLYCLLPSVDARRQNKGKPKEEYPTRDKGKQTEEYPARDKGKQTEEYPARDKGKPNEEEDDEEESKPRSRGRVRSTCLCKKYEVHCQMPDNANRWNLTYQEYAAEQCADRGGSLANLIDEESNSKVTKFIRRKGLDGPPCIDNFGFFIGLGDARREGKYVWSNGTPICHRSYTNWAENEPNNNCKKDQDGQDCVQLWFRFGNNGKWDDEYCNERPKGFICEIPTKCCCRD